MVIAKQMAQLVCGILTGFDHTRPGLLQETQVIPVVLHPLLSFVECLGPGLVVGRIHGGPCPPIGLAHARKGGLVAIASDRQRCHPAPTGLHC